VKMTRSSAAADVSKAQLARCSSEKNDVAHRFVQKRLLHSFQTCFHFGNSDKNLKECDMALKFSSASGINECQEVCLGVELSRRVKSQDLTVVCEPTVQTTVDLHDPIGLHILLRG
jgi:hypothetical protein